ncbi:toxin [Bacillus thuringiensis serovar shandongiensis]|uniref:RICIN domain-containing protein n=1 Tax=Bacillus toyonensis TaxID=155322 RepID=UPI0001ED280F|nr:RICIN domain-containing protein [Bacillus toyonensis]MEC2391875.1 RICIN domain-containing protein [Bacillus toyonensis]OTX33890.1 toxin [Bacillus thuringiensis serovar malayensis]OUB05606.1 toxin [Bacillus thuringiensis serovar shandongiensis]
MKFLSKKAMTGLLVGATTLSIWAPASEAAPANNQYYSINLQANQNLVWDVSGSLELPGRPIKNKDIILSNANNNDNQQFAFFPLDDGRYAIVNKNSGKSAIGFDEALLDVSWDGSPAQQWYLRDKGSNNYEIVNQGNGKVASYGKLYTPIPASIQEIVDLDDSNPSDPDRVFYIGNSLSSFELPTLPATGNRPDAPNYTGSVDQQLPQTSNSVVVGASLIPCIMVKDSQASDYTKIHNSPYYTLVKEEYWDKTFSAVIPAGITRTYSFKTGMTSVDQQKMTDTLSMKIGADFGLKYGDSTASLKSEISRTIQTEITSTDTEASEETVNSTVTSEPGKTTGFTEYQLATKYTLKRADGSIVSDPWIVKNNKITVARKNAQ